MTEPNWVLNEDNLLLTEMLGGAPATPGMQKNQIFHRDGIAWWDAPVPRRWHRCTPQTKGIMNWFELVYRCACGAISEDGKHWLEKNQRKRRRNR